MKKQSFERELHSLLFGNKPGRGQAEKLTHYPAAAKPDLNFEALEHRIWNRYLNETKTENRRSMFSSWFFTAFPPAFAVALVAAGIAAIWFSGVFRSGAVVTENFSHRGEKLQAVQISPALSARVRQAENVTYEKSADKIVMTAPVFSGVIELAKGSGTKLEIRTPQANFRIIGTRFLLLSSATATRLSVTEGVVAAERAGKTYRIEAGSSFESSAEEARVSALPVAALRQIEEFASPEIANSDAAKLLQQESAPVQTASAPGIPRKKVRLMLKSGSVLSGEWLGESADAYTIRRGAANVISVPKEEVREAVVE